MVEIVEKVLAAVRLAERLKYTLRHSWLSDGRHESVAEHSWRMSLMALLVAPHLDANVDVEKLLKMVIVHDLVEAIAGDIPVFDVVNDSTMRILKRKREDDAMKQIFEMLPEINGEEVERLWREFETSSSIEAKVAKALDKLEAQIQHNEAPLATWLDVERNLMHSLEAYTSFDTFLDGIRSIVVDEAKSKIAESGSR
ncbi:HD domain-containing protein [Trinickia fusca]|uniref:HD domain-containing protein n=1 Tax=Trinickia fusca TaxID=2419777 RepID=UPI001C7DD409|nr:HD domain-containing protein [Trinickia fusca]